jgi:hypothetical protein
MSGSQGGEYKGVIRPDNGDSTHYKTLVNFYDTTWS